MPEFILNNLIPEELPAPLSADSKLENKEIAKRSSDVNNPKLSDAQLDRVAEFLVDLAKLLIASTFISFFFPASTGGRINPLSFIVGTGVAASLFIFGIKITPAKKL